MDCFGKYSEFSVLLFSENGRIQGAKAAKPGEHLSISPLISA